MGKFVTGLMAAVLSAATLATAFVPVQAGAMPRAGATLPTAVENVDYYVRRGYRDRREYDRGHRHGYYRGYRGYPHYREGYRRYNDGYWYPLAAFTAGALIGGAVASQPRYYDGGGVNPRHFDWCAARYRSYRAYDNTFQPYYGPRQQCLSPYY